MKLNNCMEIKKMTGQSSIVPAIYSHSLKLAASEFVYDYSEAMRIKKESELMDEENNLASMIYLVFNESQDLINRFKTGEELLLCRGVRVRLADGEIVILRLKNRLPFPMDFSYIDLASLGSNVEFQVTDLISRFKMNQSYQVSDDFVERVSEIADRARSLNDFHQRVAALSKDAERVVSQMNLQRELTRISIRKREPIL